MKVKILAIGVVLVLLLSALAGCGGIQKGYVIEKTFSPSHSYFTAGYTTENCEKVNKKEECQEHYHPGVWHSYPAKWELELSTCTPQQQNSNCQTNWIDVSAEAYTTYKVGEYIDLSNQ